MRRTIDQFLSKRSGPELTIGSCLVVLVVALVDHFTGFELSFSIFYLIPITLASWYAGRRVGFLICMASALSWYVVDHSAGHAYSQAAIPVWNAVVRFGFFVITSYLVTQLQAALEAQETLAQQDALTGLLNSRTFDSNCKRLFELASRHHHPLSLGYVDLDDFKSVNDNFGHSVGDAVLRAVASALAQRLRTSDLVARVGGDEFAILLPETDVGGATVIFSEVRQDLLDVAAKNRWQIGFSIGVAVFDTPPAQPDEAIRIADQLMYRVKNGKRNSLLIQPYSYGASPFA
jgi:diguanylate cyclase (GGDEF)-like protein